MKNRKSTMLLINLLTIFFLSCFNKKNVANYTETETSKKMLV